MTSVGAKTKKIFDGRYEIIGIVGRGSQSVVYHARHALVPTTEVALKVLVQNSSKKGRDNISERLRQEALAMVSARHKYVIRIDDFHVIDTLCYLSMEYAPLGDLRIFVSGKPAQRLAPNLAERFMRQSLEALQFIHKSGIIHRDIKPDNILVMNEQEIRVADFGVATLPGQKSSLDELQSGVGTMDYMAPEVLEGIQYKESADIYALGVTFYELVSGLHPFKDVALSKQLEIRRSDIKPLKSIVPEISSHLNNAIMAAMRYDLKDRPKSASELMQILTGGGSKAATNGPVSRQDKVSDQSSTSAATLTRTERTSSATEMLGRLEEIKRDSTEASDARDNARDNSEQAKKLASDESSKQPIEKQVDNAMQPLFKEQVVSNSDVPSWAIRPSHPPLKAEIVKTEIKSGSEAIQSQAPVTEVITNPALLEIQKSATNDVINTQSSQPHLATPKRSGKDLELSFKKTVTIDRNEVENIREQAKKHGVATDSQLANQLNNEQTGGATAAQNHTDSIHSQSTSLHIIPGHKPNWQKIAIATIGLAALAMFVFWRPNKDEVTLNSAPITEQQTQAEDLTKELAQEKRLFPLFASGIYEGQIENFLPNQKIPFSIVSFEDRKLLVVIVGVHGWSPSIISTKDLSAGQALRVSSNGTILRFTGMNSEDGEIVGYFKNLVFGEEGQWRVRAKSTKATK